MCAHVFERERESERGGSVAVCACDKINMNITSYLQGQNPDTTPAKMIPALWHPQEKKRRATAAPYRVSVSIPMAVPPFSFIYNLFLSPASVIGRGRSRWVKGAVGLFLVWLLFVVHPAALCVRQGWCDSCTGGDKDVSEEMMTLLGTPAVPRGFY